MLTEILSVRSGPGAHQRGQQRARRDRPRGDRRARRRRPHSPGGSPPRTCNGSATGTGRTADLRHRELPRNLAAQAITSAPACGVSRWAASTYIAILVRPTAMRTPSRPCAAGRGIRGSCRASMTSSPHPPGSSDGHEPCPTPSTPPSMKRSSSRTTNSPTHPSRTAPGAYSWWPKGLWQERQAYSARWRPRQTRRAAATEWFAVAAADSVPMERPTIGEGARAPGDVAGRRNTGWRVITQRASAAVQRQEDTRRPAICAGYQIAGRLSTKSFAAGCWRTPGVGDAWNRVPVRQAATTGPSHRRHTARLGVWTAWP